MVLARKVRVKGAADLLVGREAGADARAAKVLIYLNH
jgi:hypothetical protein